jgi:hypothetical protein
LEIFSNKVRMSGKSKRNPGNRNKKPRNPDKNHGNPNINLGNPNKQRIEILFGFPSFVQKI